MSEKLLHQILAEVKVLRSDVSRVKADITGMKAQLDENTQMIKFIRDRQRETDTQSTDLSPDIQGMQNDLVTLTKIVAELQTDLAFTLHKTYSNEKEIFFLRKKNFDNKMS